MHAIYEGDPAAADVDEVIRVYPGFLAIAIYRVALLRLAAQDLSAALRIDANLAAAAAELSHLRHGTADFADARIWAERALLVDGYQLDAPNITHRLAMATFELGRDAEALQLCREALQRFGEQDLGLHGCILEVLAFGDSTPDVAAAWRHFDRMAQDPVSLPRTLARYEALVAAVLAREGQADIAKRVLERVRARYAAEFGTPDMLCLEAAVRFRLGQHESARELLRAYMALDTPEREFNLSRRALKPYLHLLAAEPPRY